MSWFKILFSQSNKACIIVKVNTVVLLMLFYKKTITTKSKLPQELNLETYLILLEDLL